MNLLFLLSIVVAFICGSLLTGCFWPTRPRPALLLAVMALPAGLVLTSASFFFWTVISGGRSNWYPVVEVILLFLAMAVVWFRQHKGDRAWWPVLRWRLPITHVSVLSGLLLLICASLCFVITCKLADVNPWGYWDAWARINHKARFLFAGGDNWTWVFHTVAVAHPDYPLLLPCTVARIWSWGGEIDLRGPQLLSVIWGVWSLVVLYSMVSWLRSSLTAAILGLAYLTYQPLLFWSAAQYADLPLVCLMLLAWGMLTAVRQFPDHARNFACLAGFFAGSAAWCKNEGIVFLLLIFIWWVLCFLKMRIFDRNKTILCFFFGLTIPVGALLVLKTVYAGKTDIIADNSFAPQSIFALVADGERHRIIFESIGHLFDSSWSGGPLILVAAAFLLQHLCSCQRIAHVGTIVSVAAMIAVYYLVFLTTPHDLHWHLGTAIDRLILQLWPVFLLGLAVMFEEVPPEVV